MRDILFRGKRIDNGEWVYGVPINREEDHVYIITSTLGTHAKSDINNMLCTGFKVIPETVGQYTGMKDKNNMRIFEGDIILPHGYKPEACPVFYEDFCFTIDSNICVLCVADKEDIEVIGNYYDNLRLREASDEEETT